MRNEAQDKEIGARLEITRLALGYPKQTDWAEAINAVTPMSVQRWNAYECGREGLPWRVAMALCGHPDWGLSLDWLYRGKRGELPQRLIKAIEAVEKSRR